MNTEVICIDNQEYLCERTTDITPGDFIIKEFSNGEKSINKIVFTSKKRNVLKFKKIAGDGKYDFGQDTFKNEIRRAYAPPMKLETYFAKIVGIGHQLSS